MKLAVSNIAWDSENNDEVFRTMKSLSFVGLEIAPTKFVQVNPYSQESIELAKKIITSIECEYGLEVCSMQSILFGVKDRLFFGEDESQRLMVQIKNAIFYAGQIGCNNLVFGCPANRSVVDLDSQYQIAIQFFKELGEYALKNNVVLAIEANPTIYNTNFINTTKDAIEIVREVDSQGFLLNFDFGTVIQNGENLDDIEPFFYYINHIHISEPYLAQIAKREEHEKLFEIISKCGYNKYVSIEMKQQESLSAILEAMSYISKLAE